MTAEIVPPPGRGDDSPAGDRPATALPAPLTSTFPPGLVERLATGVTTGSSPASTPVRTPLTGETVAELPLSNPGDVQVAYERARRAQEAWSRVSLAQRAAVLLRYHDLVLERRNEVLDLIQIESGKARAHAVEEVLDVAAVCRYYARVGHDHLRPRRRSGALPLTVSAWETRVPKGVVGVITPWSHPFSLAVTDALPALLAGNGVVLKPDTRGALTALWARSVLVEAGLPAELMQVVLGDGPVLGPSVIDHADHVCFTGSTRTGRVVAQQAAYGLISCSLELGGKNSMIVLPDANLRRAAAGAVRACFSSAGQFCLSTERLVVHESVREEFLRLLLERVGRLRLGASLGFDVDMGGLGGPEQLEKVVRHVRDAVEKGATVLAGGRARPDLGPYFHEPTVLADVRPHMLVHTEETFGPVVSVHTFATEDEAVAIANDSDHGLSCSLWTRDTANARRMAGRIRAGAVNVNEGYAAAWGSVGAPVGGMRDSGLSRRHGVEGILQHTEAQTVALQRLAVLEPWWGMGWRRWSGLLVRMMRLARAARLR